MVALASSGSIVKVLLQVRGVVVEWSGVGGARRRLTRRGDAIKEHGTTIGGGLSGSSSEHFSSSSVKDTSATAGDAVHESAEMVM